MKVAVLVRRQSRNIDAVIRASNIANRVQPDFEFDVQQVHWLPRGNSVVNPKEVVQTIKEKHPDKPVIAVISPPLMGGYFDYASRGRNIVSTADWEREFAPPPLSIYILFQFAYAAASFAANLSPRQVDRQMRHNGFRGCIFNSTKGPKKFLSVLIAGYVCVDCQAQLRKFCVPTRQMDSIGHILSHVRDFTIDKPRYMPESVFIGHGRRSDWEKIKSHISKKHHLKVEEFNMSPTAGLTTVERLKEMLDSASFAILVMTAEDRRRDGKLNARQNVVHEIGLLQGKLGFRRAIVVKEEEVQEFSNIKGLTYISYKRGKIAGALPEIDRVLVRKHVIQGGKA